MSKIFNYKYYILDKNKSAFGVIDETFGKVKYHALKIELIWDDFQNKEVEAIVKWGEYEADIKKLQESYSDVDLTKDYWTAFSHMTGTKRKAINTNDSTAA